MDAIVAALGIAGLLMIAFSSALARNKRSLDARLAVIDRRLQIVMDHLGAVEPEPEETTDIVGHLVAGRKIQAVKIYRDRTGAGLKEAKDAVEEIGRRRGI